MAASTVIEPRAVQVESYSVLPSSAPRCSTLPRGGPSRYDGHAVSGKIIFGKVTCVRSSGFMHPYRYENLSHDAIHGYIPFTTRPAREGESCERDVIDHPWVQRLRQIHQLQTAWWVFPTAEHTRFQHVLGAMHLGSTVIDRWYDSLHRACPDVPSRSYVESLLRLAALLHDVGHGPFGHFFDAHFLSDYGLNHERLGAAIITDVLRDVLRNIRMNPRGRLGADERIDPNQIAWLIQRPKGGDSDSVPRWLVMLRSLFCGLYTVDNMDFVLRDAYMSGYSTHAFDLDRLLHYTFFSSQGLTIHEKGIDALMRFLAVRGELFRSLYFHRTVRAIDLQLADLFREGKDLLFHGNPLERLDAYLHFTEWSLLVDVRRWRAAEDARRREMGLRWEELLDRRIHYKMVCQRTQVYGAGEAESASLLSSPDFVEQKVRDQLPASQRDIIPFRVDIARHMHRPHTAGPARGQNFLYDAAHDTVRPLDAHDLYRRLPISHRICRIYAPTLEHRDALTGALDAILGGAAEDDATNM